MTLAPVVFRCASKRARPLPRGGFITAPARQKMGEKIGGDGGVNFNASRRAPR